MPLLLIIGPSGTGKSTLLRGLDSELNINIVPTWTTRPPRGDESNDSEHIYATDDEFDAQSFVATVEPFSLPYRYGLPVFRLSNDTLTVIMMRADQAAQLKSRFSDAIIYQIEAPYSAVSDRLAARESSGETSGSRLDDYEKEQAAGRQIANRVFQNDQSPASLHNQVVASLKIDFPTLFS